MSRSVYWRCFVIIAVFGVGLANPAFGGPDEERRFRALVDRCLELSCGSNSISEQFQFEHRLRVIDEGGAIIEYRIIGERSKDKVAALLHSPNGFPACLLVGRSFLAVGSDAIQVFQGGHFKYHAGVTAKGVPGIDLASLPNTSAESQITVDFGSLARWFMVDGAEYGWDEYAARYWVATPKGAQISVYIHRRAGSEQFPIRAVVTTGRGGDRRLEMAISNIYVGAPPPRTLLQMAKMEDVPFVPRSFAQIKESRLDDLGISFDESDPAARKLGVKLLHAFQKQQGLVMNATELSRIEVLLSSLDDTTDADARHVLSELRSVGARHVWRELERRHARKARELEREDAPSYPSFHIDYDRSAAAAHTEIAFGPVLARALRQNLLSIVTDPYFTVVTRCDALDVLGQYGLPVFSPVLTDVEESIKKDSSDELQVVLSSVRVRHCLAGDEDLERLHRVAGEGRLIPDVLTQVIEALAIVDELGPHAAILDSLVGGETADVARIPRRVRALAADTVGQSALLDLLERGSEAILPIHGITALAEALRPCEEPWPRLLRWCQEIALNEEASVENRVAANRLVHRDTVALASSYTEEFFRSALKSGDVNLMYGAMCNMVLAAKATSCYEALQTRLGDSNPAKRVDIAMLLTGIASFTRLRDEQLPPSFWSCFDMILADPDPEVRRFGPTAVLLLLDLDTAIPASYVSPLVEMALAARDPTQLALACVALTRLTHSDYMPTYPHDVKTNPDIIHWIRGNTRQVREHMQSWYENWQKARTR